ncbi:MAG: isoprenylcysteine carboxylmethyltransferase family protein [Candidatus Thorarchaeota archaeon]
MEESDPSIGDSTPDKEKFLEMMMPGNHTYQAVFGVIFLIVWTIDSFLLRITTFVGDMIPFWIPLIPAAVVFLVCIYLVDASHKDLFNAGPFGLRTNGIFSKVRHPMYLGTALAYLSLAVATLSLASILLFSVILIGYNHIADYEERKLEERFGTDFLEYRKRVGQWFPRLR